MEWSSERITELTWKYLKDELSASEREELDVWLSDPYNRARFNERVRTENIWEVKMLWDLAKEQPPVPEWSSGQAAGGARLVSISEVGRTNIRKVRWMAAAAIVLVLAGAAIWLKPSDKKEQRTVPVVAAANRLPPGSNKAVLILGDNRQIALDNAGTGSVAMQGRTQVVKTDSALLSYRIQKFSNNPTGKAAGIVFNTLVTPRGGQYKLRLADGTTVYLNAQSSLRFPVAFEGKARKVELRGEGYFEVAQNPARPFVVELSGGKEVTVLGTRFDVRDYEDDPGAEATLLEGSVRVTDDGRSAVLALDERATLDPGGHLTVARDEEAETSIAWTKGLFRFNNLPLENVMRQLSRWYDIDIIFKGSFPDVPITASISRNTSALEVLDALKEIAGVTYRVEGKRIIVMH